MEETNQELINSAPTKTATKQRRKPRMSAEEITLRYFGDEPRWTKPTEENSEAHQLGTLLNWYSYHKEKKDAKNFIVTYLKKIGEDKNFISGVENLSEDHFITTMGWVARILSFSPEGMSDKPKSHLDKFVSKLKLIVDEKEKIKKAAEEIKPTQRVDIQQILEEQLRGYLGHVAGEIDSFIENNFKNDFDLRGWLASGNVKAIQAKRIAEQLETDVTELKEALAKTDPQLIEGYSHWTDKQLKSVIGFYERLIFEAKDWYDCAKELGKIHRKPRMRKMKSPEQQTAKVKYQRKDEQNNLISVEPKKLIGATQVWVYNTKYRMLGVYNAANDRGMMVKGTTLYNFDETTSIEKKLRKPEQVLPKIVDGGKVALRKVMDTIRCKHRVLSGRINEHTIIIKVF